MRGGKRHSTAEKTKAHNSVYKKRGSKYREMEKRYKEVYDRVEKKNRKDQGHE